MQTRYNKASDRYERIPSEEKITARSLQDAEPAINERARRIAEGGEPSTLGEAHRQYGERNTETEAIQTPKETFLTAPTVKEPTRKSTQSDMFGIVPGTMEGKIPSEEALGQPGASSGRFALL